MKALVTLSATVLALGLCVGPAQSASISGQAAKLLHVTKPAAAIETSVGNVIGIMTGGGVTVANTIVGVITAGTMDGGVITASVITTIGDNGFIRNQVWAQAPGGPAPFSC